MNLASSEARAIKGFKSINVLKVCIFLQLCFLNTGMLGNNISPEIWNARFDKGLNYKFRLWGPRSELLLILWRHKEKTNQAWTVLMAHVCLLQEHSLLNSDSGLTGWQVDLEEKTWRDWRLQKMKCCDIFGVWTHKWWRVSVRAEQKICTNPIPYK